MGQNTGKEKVMVLRSAGISIGQSENEHGSKGIWAMLGTFIL